MTLMKLDSNAAAEYLGLPIEEFERLGIYHLIRSDGEKIYHVHDLDHWRQAETRRKAEQARYELAEARLHRRFKRKRRPIGYFL